MTDKCSVCGKYRKEIREVNEPKLSLSTEAFLCVRCHNLWLCDEWDKILELIKIKLTGGRYER